MSHKITNTVFFLLLHMSIASAKDNIPLTSTLSESPQLIDYKNSSETPTGYDEQARRIRFRAVCDTPTPCPRYESWRTGFCDKKKENLLSLKLTKPIKTGLIIACANEGTAFSSTIIKTNDAKEAPVKSSSIAVINLPVSTQISGVDFVSDTLQEKLNNHFIMMKNAKTQTNAKAMRFVLHGLYFFPENWINIAPAANVAVSNTVLHKAAEKNSVQATGLNDMKIEGIWRGEDKGQGCDSILTWQKPIDVAAVGFYFSWNSYGEMPRAVALFGKKKPQDEWKEILNFDKFDNNPYTGKKLYILPIPNQKLTELKISYQAAKKQVAISEVFVFCPADKQSIVQKEETSESSIITINADVPKSGNITLVVNDKDGKRIRNLVANTPVIVKKESVLLGLLSSVEPTKFNWDGLDDSGQVVPPGEYAYKGIVHDPLQAQYQLSIYNAGNPPWTSCSLKGGWLSDHCAPSSMLYLSDSIWVGAPMAEAGSTIMQLNLEGHKQWGIRWLDLAGAEYLASDNGQLYVASEGGWRKNRLSVITLDPVSKDFKRLLDLQVPKPDNKKDAKVISGFAVQDNMAYLSFPSENAIKIYSLSDGSLKQTFSVKHPKAIVATNGHIYFISENIIQALAPGSLNYKTIIKDQLADPVNFCVDKNGWFYVCDQGTNQVKIFVPEPGQTKGGSVTKVVGQEKWKFDKAIGKAGGRQDGIYDPMCFDGPSAVTVTPNGDIWIAEKSKCPKRISIWNKNGTLLKEFLGNGEYACGGSLDPEDSSRYFAEGMEFVLDLDKKTSSLKSVYYQNNPSRFLNSIPERAIRSHGRLFLVQDKHWHRPFFWVGVMDDTTHILKPVAAVGRYEKVAQYFKQRHPQVPKDQEKDFTFLWNDDDQDGQIEWEEINARQGEFSPLPWGCHIDNAMRIYWYCTKNNEFQELAPISWKQGVPSYSFNNLKTLNTSSKSKWTNISFHRLDKTRLLLNSKPYYKCVDPNSGKVHWTYNNPFPCNTHDSPLPQSGDIQHTLQIEGVVDMDDNIGSIFSLNSNKGLRHLFTTDGLYIAPVFRDMRLSPTMSFVKQVTVGDDLIDYSLEDEAFNGTFQRGSDGKIYMVCGKHHHSVFLINGLESIQRFEGTFTVTPEQVKQASENLLRHKEREMNRKIAKPIILSKVKDKRKLSWNTWSASAIEQHDKELCKVALGIDQNNFYFSAKINDATPFINNGKDERMLFKTGDSFNIELGAKRSSLKDKKPIPGDVRLLIAPFNDKPTCVAYFYKTPGTKKPVAFSSPWNTTLVDQVKVLENAKVTVKKQGNSYVLTGEIPRKDIGLESDIKTLYGDFGVIFSDASGSRNSYTIFYASPAKGVTTDVPSEIRLLPEYWREFKTAQ